MSATTLASLSSLLGTYVEPSGDFKASLNQVLARMYNMGTYRDLTVQYSLPVVNGCITLPDDADSVLHTMINGNPAPVRALWHDFKSVGLNSTYPNSNQADLSWGLIDAGFAPIAQLMDGFFEDLYITRSDYNLSNHDFDPTTGETIAIIGFSSADGKLYTGLPSELDALKIEFSAPIDDIVSISFSGLNNSYNINTHYLGSGYDGFSNKVLATVGPEDGVTRYRRFRLNNSTDGQTTVHVLCKRAFKPLQHDTDISYINNISAIKQGLLGRLMEDNGDIERSEYHWNKCLLMLEEEAASTRGAAMPRLNVDPYGIGQQGRILNLY